MRHSSRNSYEDHSFHFLSPDLNIGGVVRQSRADFIRDKNKRQRRKQPIKVPASLKTLIYTFKYLSIDRKHEFHRFIGGFAAVIYSAPLTICSRLRYRVEEGIGRDPMDGNVDKERLRSPASLRMQLLARHLGCGRRNLRRQRGCLLFRGVKNKWVELGNVTSSLSRDNKNEIPSPSLSLPRVRRCAHFLETCIARRKVAWLCLQLLYIYIFIHRQTILEILFNRLDVALKIEGNSSTAYSYR